MLFLPSRKILFIKTNKTASTSLEIALSRLFFAESDLYFTPLDFDDECLRMRLCPALYNKNASYSSQFSKLKRIAASAKWFRDNIKYFSENIWSDYSNYHYLRSAHRLYVRGHRYKNGFHPHISYSDFVAIAPELVDFYSFAFARHPYKRFYSFLLYQAKCHSNSKCSDWTHDEWIKFAYDVMPLFIRRSIRSFVYDSSSTSYVSALYTFENMKASCALLSLRFGFEEHQLFDLLPATKVSSSFSSKGIDLADVLSPEIRSLIQDVEGWTFETFGYKDSVTDFQPSVVSRGNL